MCLYSIHGEGQKKATIKKLKIDKDGYITLWKVFRIDDEDNLIGRFRNYQFYEGKNTARCKFIRTIYGKKVWQQYAPGFHSFTNEKDAEQWADLTVSPAFDVEAYPIKIKKEWISDMGVQGERTVVVSKHIII